MDSLNITHTVLSITAPGTHLDPTDDILAQKVTREANEYMSSLCVQHPTRFSFFASLPLPSIFLSIGEIAHARKLPGLKGFALLTNAHGTYLGDAAFDPIFAALHEMKALVFIHPTNCHHIGPAGVDIVNPLSHLPGSMLEYIFDSTRCMTSLLLSATPQRFPDLTFILPHCGTTLSTTLARIAGFSGKMLKTKLIGAVGLEEMKKVLNERFFFDLAGFVLPDQVAGVLAAGLGGRNGERLVYGTDFPYMNKDILTELAGELESGLPGLFERKDEAIEGIYVGNAKKLLGL